MKKCNRDCFNCIYEDCIINTITKEEREESEKRDINYTNFGIIRFQRPKRKKYNINRR